MIDSWVSFSSAGKWYWPMKPLLLIYPVRRWGFWRHPHSNSRFMVGSRHECCSDTRTLSLHIYDASMERSTRMPFWHGCYFDMGCCPDHIIKFCYLPGTACEAIHKATPEEPHSLSCSVALTWCAILIWPTVLTRFAVLTVILTWSVDPTAMLPKHAQLVSLLWLAHSL
jgi:hypothetical protein